MFKEVLKIIPSLDGAALRKMEQALTTRFGRVAKKFSKGLSVGMMGAIGGAVAAKLLSPLKEAQDAIESALRSADDVVTNSAQFGTSPGELLKLQALGKLKGLEPDALNTLVSKFQTAIAEASADPGKPTSVRRFVGETDMAKAFLEFMQSLQTMSPTDQTRVQQEVFGEKQILKMAEFLQSDFPASIRALGNVDWDKANDALLKLEGVEGFERETAVRRELQDLFTKAGIINRGQIKSIDQSERQRLGIENENIRNFDQVMSMDMAVREIEKNVSRLLQEMLTQIPAITGGINLVVDLLRKSVEGYRELFKFLKDIPGFRLFKRGGGG